MFTLYGDNRSGNCYKAAWLLSLLGEEFEWVETDVMAGATRGPEFMAMNANGRVPLLKFHDGRLLAESNAMLLYLAEGSPYLPDPGYLRALVYQWLFFEQYSHEPYIAVARFIVVLAGREVEEAERLMQLRQKGHDALGVMETQLGSSPFLAGDRFTVADIALYAYTHVAPEAGFELERFQNVKSWLSRVESVPGFRNIATVCR